MFGLNSGKIPTEDNMVECTYRVLPCIYNHDHESLSRAQLMAEKLTTLDRVVASPKYHDIKQSVFNQTLSIFLTKYSL